MIRAMQVMQMSTTLTMAPLSAKLICQCESAMAIDFGYTNSMMLRQLSMTSAKCATARYRYTYGIPMRCMQSGMQVTLTRQDAAQPKNHDHRKYVHRRNFKNDLACACRPSYKYPADAKVSLLHMYTCTLANSDSALDTAWVEFKSFG